MAEHPTRITATAHKPKSQHKKLSRLPNNYKISKRPLLRPAIPSPHAGAQNPKIVYISAKTPFLSAVKRVERLLDLADKRLVQSATTLAKQGKNQGYHAGKRKRGAGEDDEILEISETVERTKRRKRDDQDGVHSAGEELVLKGTGKAIQKCLELAQWFQQREEYSIRLQTGSVGAIDDIAVDEEADGGVSEAGGMGGGSAAGDMLMDEYPSPEAEDKSDAQGAVGPGKDSDERRLDKPNDATVLKPLSGNTGRRKPVSAVPESRIRYTSSVEVYVSLR